MPGTININVQTTWSPQIEVWREYELLGAFMEPDFIPDLGHVLESYDDAYIECIPFNNWPGILPMPQGQGDMRLNASVSTEPGNNVIDYVDDLLPSGPDPDYYDYSAPFHDPLVEYLTPPDAFHVQGIFKFLAYQDYRGWTLNIHYQDYDYNKHVYIAVGAIREWYNQDSWVFVNQRTVIHELGHAIANLWHNDCCLPNGDPSPWVMSGPCIHQPPHPLGLTLFFSPEHIERLRSGPNVGD